MIAPGRSLQKLFHLAKRPSRWLAVIAAALLPLGGEAPSSAGGEYEVKATFLYAIAKFAEWPPDKLEPNSPLLVGIYGKDPFGATLDQTFHGKTVNGRVLTVQRLIGLERAGQFHILFISSAEKKRVSQILSALNTESVMTVAEMANFTEQGGMVNFVLRDNSVGLEINAGAAERAHIHISSKLLKLARVVQDQGQAKRN